jgi:predicted deacylase
MTNTFEPILAKCAGGLTPLALPGHASDAIKEKNRLAAAAFLEARSLAKASMSPAERSAAATARQNSYYARKKLTITVEAADQTEAQKKQAEIDACWGTKQ